MLRCACTNQSAQEYPCVWHVVTHLDIPTGMWDREECILLHGRDRGREGGKEGGREGEMERGEREGGRGKWGDGGGETTYIGAFSTFVTCSFN